MLKWLMWFRNYRSPHLMLDWLWGADEVDRLLKEEGYQ